ncbi:hypothetical protein D3C77_365110 [compost metagenome]
MINKAAFSVCAELANVTPHQPIDGAGDHGKHEQRHGQDEDRQADHEGENREQCCQQVILYHDVRLSELPLKRGGVTEQLQVVVGLRPAGADHDPVVQVLKDFRGRLRRFLHEQRTLEVAAEPAELGLPHGMAVMPALLWPQPQHAPELQYDGEHQRGEQQA